jgi:hypothetical protein
VGHLRLVEQGGQTRKPLATDDTDLDLLALDGDGVGGDKAGVEEVDELDGPVGLERRFSRGKSTGTSDFASAAYSSAGSWARMALRGLEVVNGVETLAAGTGIFLCASWFALAAKTVVREVRAVDAIVFYVTERSGLSLFTTAHSGDSGG